jgi:hypothetical protein
MVIVQRLLQRCQKFFTTFVKKYLAALDIGKRFLGPDSGKRMGIYKLKGIKSFYFIYTHSLPETEPGNRFHASEMLATDFPHKNTPHGVIFEENLRNKNCRFETALSAAPKPN